MTIDKRKSVARTLVLLALIVFFSANTLYMFEVTPSEIQASTSEKYSLDFEKAKTKGPRLNLKAALLVDYDSDEVIYAKNCEKLRPIASISKLVTAMVLVDSKIDLNKTEKITKEDAYRSSRSRLSVGFEMTLYDLLHAALLNSDNRAARALARATYGSIEAFAREMNKKCREMGLKSTIFYEPTGLNSKNVSTAVEVAKIIHYAYQYELIAKVTSTKQYRVKILNKKNTYRQMANTNLLTISPYRVLTGKTGYIRAADYCLATLVKNRAGRRLTAVVLGVPGDKLRFREARKLIDWGYKQLH
ncbi:MAG: serine hydrolase [bacterium]|nr:serine hydrolase [bacterium]